MAQVTYRGIKYDTTERKQAQSQQVQETYRGVKFNKLVTAQSLTYSKNQAGVYTPAFLIYNYN